MSEPAAKRRLRATKRRLGPAWAKDGWKVTWLENGPFHVLLERGSTRRKIRICFDLPDKGDIVTVGHEPGSFRTSREILYIDPTGRNELTLSFGGTLSDPLAGKFR